MTEVHVVDSKLIDPRSFEKKVLETNGGRSRQARTGDEATRQHAHGARHIEDGGMAVAKRITKANETYLDELEWDN